MIQILFLLVVSGLMLTGCSPTEVVSSGDLGEIREGGAAPQIEPEAKALYHQAEKAFDARNFDSSAKLFQQVKIKFPRGKAQVFASYRLGIIYYYRESYAAAAKEFEYFVVRMPGSDLIFDATYNWAACEHQLGRNDRAYSVLSRLKMGDVQAQGPKRAETVYQLTARVASAVGNHPAAVAAYALQLQLPLEESVRTIVETRVDEQIALLGTPQKLQSLLDEVSEPTVRRKVEARLSQLNAGSGAEMVPGFPAPLPPIAVGPAPTTPSETPVTLPSGGSAGSSSHIGVILPLSGKWAVYGNRALDGILLASRIFNETAGTNFKIFVKDSGSNPISAQNAVEELYSRHGVMAVIGPIASKEAIAVGEKAQSLGLPNISLSSKEGVSDKSPYLFQTGLTPGVQIENLVRYAVQGKGFKRFAILAPNNAFGRDMAQSFWDYVTANGATVASYQLYPPDEKDFQDQVRSMVGLQDLKYRKLEVAKLAEYVKEIKAKTGKEPKVQLPPLIDFDAIFIPDSPKAVSQAAASLHYYDVSHVPLLGTAEWNSEQFYRRSGNLIRSAIFPAGLYLGSVQASTKDFVKNYQEAYGQTPDLLAAQSYEAMLILSAALENSRSEDRNQLANALSTMREFESPLGTLSFDAQRIGRRKMAVLSLDGGSSLSEH